MKSKFKNKKGFAHRSTIKGFTLIETLVGVLIFVMIALSLSIFSKNTWDYNTFISGGLTNADADRQILKTMTAEIRTASTADTGAYVINSATASGFTFYSDIDDDGLKEQVRYFLVGTSFQKGVTKPTGSPLIYDPANEKISTLVYNVTNSSIFSYYDKNYDGTTAALAFPVDVPSVRLVKITMTIDKDPNHSPAPVTFTTQVSIRNLKDNL